MLEIVAAALLKAQNAYDKGLTQKADLPKEVQMQNDTVNFHKMATQQLNKFSKMTPEQIMSHVKQTNPEATQMTSVVNSGCLANQVGSLAKAIKTNEGKQKKYLVGDASLTEVIEATTEPKTTLQTAIAVRNKVLETFEKIMNMPI